MTVNPIVMDAMADLTFWKWALLIVMSAISWTLTDIGMSSMREAVKTGEAIVEKGKPKSSFKYKL